MLHPRFENPSTLRTALLSVLVVLVAVLFSSCIHFDFSVGDVQARNHEFTLSTLQSMLDEGEYIQVYAYAYNFMQNGKFSKAEAGAFLDKALAAMYREFDRIANNEPDAENIAQLTRLYNSFVAISEEPPIDYAELEELRREIYLNDGNIPLLINNIIRGQNLNEYPSDTLRNYAVLAEQYHQPSLLSDIISILDKRGVDHSDLDLEVKTPDFKDMVKGTVTVWVNKGPTFRDGMELLDSSLGTGFFIDYQGHIITNYHVIKSEVDTSYEGYSRLYIRPSDAQSQLVPARVISYDKILDLALLKVEIRPDFVFPISLPVSAEVADPAIALGSPVGLYNTVTSGIISAVEREILSLGTVFQFDAPAYPGSSGGPLVDETGNLIGVVFAGVGSLEGLNFAVIADWLNTVLERLYYTKSVKHPWLGLGFLQDNGLRVIYVYPNTSSFTAGIAQNDILLSINGKEVKSIAEAQAYLAEYQATTIVQTRWKRGEREFDAYLTTEVRPHSPAEEALKIESLEYLLPPLFGTELDVIRRTKKSIELVIKEVYPGTYAEFLGFQKGDELDILKWTLLPKDRRVAVLMNARQRQDVFLTRKRQLVFYLDVNLFL